MQFSIIDPHIHQWDPLTTPRMVTPLVRVLGRYPRLLDKAAAVLFPRKALETLVGRPDYVLRAYLPADYQKDATGTGISTVVHVQADWHGKRPMDAVDETRWLAGLSFGSDAPRLGAIVAHADLCSSSAAPVLDAHLAASPLVKGIRHMAAWHADCGVHSWARRDGLFGEPDFLRGFEALARRSLRFDAYVYSPQLPQVARLADRFPQTPIVLDHLGHPVGVFGPVGKETGRTARARTGILQRWKDDLAMLAERPNVYVKASGLLMACTGIGFHKRRRPAGADEIVEWIQPLVVHGLESFGPRRTMFASNFPMDKVSAALRDIVNAYVRIVEGWDEKALKPVFRDNAAQFYGIQVIPT